MPRTNPATLSERLAYAYTLHPDASADTHSTLSMREVDRLARVSLGQTAQIIGGTRRNPGGQTLGKIAGVLGCSLDWLLWGRGKAPTKKGVEDAVTTARATKKKRAKVAKNSTEEERRQ